MENEKHIELLQKILENTNMWLHFIEAKNAALIALNIAIITALISGISLCESVKLLILTISLFFIAIVCSVISFLPINKKMDKVVNDKIFKNLLHYAYISTLEADEYLNEIYKQYWNSNNNSVPKIEKDYCEEIVENSRIAMRKQKYFVISIKITLIGILFICCCYIWLYIKSLFL
ncbi:MAG: DUF5706 domain-containing protein [Eubacteriales bacterium]|nr:DUF5706 domain-containing protein [Eubacteriales bacterium]